MVYNEDLERNIRYLQGFLSFANSFNIGILGFETRRFYLSNRELRVADAISSYYAMQADPISSVENSWLTDDSDLSNYLSRFIKFKSFAERFDDQDGLPLAFLWYQQAIQSKFLAITSTAIGSALERLAYIILVKDAKDPIAAQRDWNDKNVLKSPKKRILKLLEILGIQDLKEEIIFNFTQVRNDSIHSESNSTVSSEEKVGSVRYAIQVFEETILWKIGYNGQYRDRLSSFRNNSLQTRYNSENMG